MVYVSPRWKLRLGPSSHCTAAPASSQMTYCGTFIVYIILTRITLYNIAHHRSSGCGGCEMGYGISAAFGYARVIVYNHDIQPFAELCRSVSRSVCMNICHVVYHVMSCMLHRTCPVMYAVSACRVM